jgi:hypothetical protein
VELVLEVDRLPVVGVQVVAPVEVEEPVVVWVVA